MKRLFFDEQRRIFILREFSEFEGKPIEASTGILIAEVSEEWIIKQIEKVR
jgi:hypothetical protein